MNVFVTRAAILGVAGAAAGFLLAAVTPKVYEGRAEIVLQNPQQAMDAELGDKLATQIAFLRSDGVFETALRTVAKNESRPELIQKSKQLRNMVDIDVANGSGLARIRARAYTPNTAADLANGIAAAYQYRRKQSVEDSTGKGQQEFLKRLGDAKVELDKADGALQQYMKRHNIADLDTKIQQLTQYEASLRATLDQANSDLQGLKQQLKVLDRQIQALPKEQVERRELEDDPEVIALEKKLTDLQTQKIDLLRTFTPTSSRVQALDESIRSVEQQLTTARTKPLRDKNRTITPNPQRMQLEQERAANITKQSSLAAQTKAAQVSLSNVRQEMSTLPTDKSELLRIQREREFALNRYKTLKDKADTMESESVASELYLNQVKTAAPDTDPVWPNIPLLVLLGTAIGALIGGLSAIGKKQPEPLYSPAQLEGLIGLPASSVAALPRGKSTHKIESLPDPASRPPEAYRFMALSIVSQNGTAPRSILFTGVGGNVGCSAAVGQLALALALEGKQTLLIDCDFRQSSLTKVFSQGERPGLSDILNKRLLPSADSELPLGTRHENLMFLAAGSSDNGTISDFPNSQISATLEILNARADIVLLDTPPCDVVTDAARLASMVDEVWLVVSAEHTQTDRVPLAHSILTRSGAKEIKVILTDTSGSAAPFSGSVR